MHPYFELFGHSVPAYWLCTLAGTAACTVLLLVRHREFKELREVDITNNAALAAVGMIIGARALYLITVLGIIVKNWELITGDIHVLYELLYNGMVFYGGLFGALAAILLYCRRYGLDRGVFLDYFAPALPLFHAFGRIGCFLTGCCHGIVSRRYGIAFTHSISSENGVPYFPVQLLGSALEFCLFIAVLLYEKRHRGEGKAVRFYLLVYAAGRFALEFLRGDAIRGIWFGLSTSQWISIALFLAMAVRILKERKEQESRR